MVVSSFPFEVIAIQRGMRSKRSYGDGCATAHALDLIGERWRSS
jgi:hypothetical protein